MGGGAGGIIQIISPAGRLPLNALSLKGGKQSGSCQKAKHGYHFVAGNFLWCTIQKYVKTTGSTLKTGGSDRGERDLKCQSLTTQKIMYIKALA